MMKWGIVAAVAAIIAAIGAFLVRRQGQRAIEEAELWAESDLPAQSRHPADASSA